TWSFERPAPYNNPLHLTGLRPAGECHGVSQIGRALVMSSQFVRSIHLHPGAEVDYNEFPFSVPAVQHLGKMDFHPSVTFLVGENGSGKSTLVEAIASRAGFHAAGGTKNFRSDHFESESELADSLVLARGARRESRGFFLRAETMYNVSTKALEYDPGGQYWEDLHGMSHGEGFLWVLLNRFSGDGLYILDEPEAALSPQRQLSFIARLHQLVQEGSQFIISTHSPILLGYPRSWIYLLSEDGVERVDYEETEHYQVTKAFLLNPERMLKELLR
ncbi:MAG: AAA family ATPase, partial [Myxococcota bacterium]